MTSQILTGRAVLSTLSYGELMEFELQHQQHQQQHFAYKQHNLHFKIVSSLNCRGALRWNLGLKKQSACTFISSSLHIYFVFTKICEPFGYLLFQFSILNINISTISSYCLYFTFLVETGWWERGGLSFFLLVKRGSCQKFFMMWGDLKKVCPFKGPCSPQMHCAPCTPVKSISRS